MVEFDPPCGGPSSRANVTTGADNVSTVMRQILAIKRLRFLMGTLLFRSRGKATTRVEVCAHLSRNSFTKSIVAYSW